MIIVPPRHFITIKNPAIRDPVSGVVLKDKFDMVRLAWGDEEIRLEQDPFPLYPGELWDKLVKPLKIIPANSSLKLLAIRDCLYHKLRLSDSNPWSPGQICQLF